MSRRSQVVSFCFFLASYLSRGLCCHSKRNPRCKNDDYITVTSPGRRAATRKPCLLDVIVRNRFVRFVFLPAAFCLSVINIICIIIIYFIIICIIIIIYFFIIIIIIRICIIIIIIMIIIIFLIIIIIIFLRIFFLLLESLLLEFL